MNATGYWPLAREYSIWNTVVETLQFWTADLEAHVLSNAIEQGSSAFLYPTSMHLLCQQSEEVLFGHFVTTLNAAFESKLTLEDERYESRSENFNIPTSLRQTSRSTMFPVITTSPLTLPLHMAQVLASHAANLYDANYHLEPLMKKALQLTLHLHTAPYHHRIP